MNRQTLGIVTTIASLLLIFVRQGTAAITYISAERYVQITATSPFVREDAVGFNDFEASYTRFVSAGGLPIIRVSASQQSYLHPDRIDVAAAAFTGQGLAFGGASSAFRVTFSVDVPTQFTLYTGPIFHESFEGGAAALLYAGTDISFPLLAYTESQSTPIGGLLHPGVYTFSAGASAGRLQNITGQSTTIASLVLPSPPAITVLAVACAMFNRRRRLA